MKLIRTNTLAALALSAAALALPAAAVAKDPPAPAAAPQPKLSPGAMKAIIALQAAVNAKDPATIPPALVAANAVAKSVDDRYIISQLQLKAAIDSKDPAQQSAAIAAMIASGGAPKERITELRLYDGNQRLRNKDYTGAQAALAPLLQSDPSNIDALVLNAEALNGLDRTAEAVPLMQKAALAYQAQGKPVPQDLYRRMVALAYEKKLPSAGTMAIDWVKAYPTPTNWRDAIRIYAEGSAVTEGDMIDLFRLQRATGSLKGESDYYRYSSAALGKGLPGEARGVLDEGFTSKAIDRTRPMFVETYRASGVKITADRASLAGSERIALSAATSRGAMSTGDAYLGYGEYAKAATLYRAALTKSGVDSSLANLRLGIALARSGDKAGANAALNAVSGPRQGIARLWLAYVGTLA